MTARLRPGTLRAYVFGVFTGALMTATLTMCAAPAKADAIDDAPMFATAVCNTIDDHTSYAGIIGIGMAIADNYGYSYFDAGQIIAWSVINVCPRHTALMQAFANSNLEQAFA